MCITQISLFEWVAGSISTQATPVRDKRQNVLKNEKEFYLKKR